MFEPLIYLDRSEVREGKLADLKVAMNELADLVEANEPYIVAYDVYFTDDGTQMSVVHIHRDAASLAFHMKVAGPEFPKFAEYIRLVSIDVYGAPGDEIIQQLRAKARMLGTGTVTVHQHHAGFSRLDRQVEATGA